MRGGRGEERGGGGGRGKERKTRSGKKDVSEGEIEQLYKQGHGKRNIEKSEDGER